MRYGIAKGEFVAAASRMDQERAQLEKLRIARGTQISSSPDAK